jgi:cytoskeletal protein RodZ
MKIRGMTVFLIVIVVILLVVAVIANINTFKQLGWFGGSKPKQTRTEVKQSNISKLPPQRTPQLAQNGANEANNENSAKSTDTTKWRDSLPSGQYGRKNPFQPLVGTRRASSQRGIRASKPALEGIIKQMATQGPVVQLTAVFGDQAIFKVDGSSKTVSVGDTLAGMEVASIEEGQVILKKGDKNNTIKLGEEPKRIPTGEAE